MAFRGIMTNSYCGVEQKMRPTRFFNLFVVLLLMAVSSVIPTPVIADRFSLQATGDLIGDGQVCNSQGQCGEFSITFNPIGGQVAGSVNVTWPITDVASGVKIGEEVLQGTLIGTFDGGDGGVVRGTMATGQVTITYFVTCPTCVNAIQNTVGTPWEGTLRADGTGNGWIGPVDILWNITYSASDFQTGLGGNKRATKTPGTGMQGTGTPQPTVSGENITAVGQFCDDQYGFCGEMSITFNPTGGPVTGYFSGTYTPLNDDTILKVNGTLEGIFTGGDGGELGGTIQPGIWDWTCPSCNFVYATPASLSGYPWDGKLYANGTGAGSLYTDATWNVTFSADAFRAGLTAAGQSAGTPTPDNQDYIQQQIGGISVEMGDKPWTEHELQMLNEVLSQLPPNLRNQLSLQHIVRYSSKLDIYTGSSSNVMGDYSAWDQRDCPDCARSANTIRIFDRATQSSYFSDASGDTDFKATILHEITHALQSYKTDEDIYKYPSDNPIVQNFIAISKTPGYNDGWDWDAVNRKWVYYTAQGSGNNPPTNYATTNPMEDLSESVKMYVYNPQLLQTDSPQRYTYIRDQIFGGIEYQNGKQK